MNRLSKNENRRSGFTLTEAAIVLGIAGLLLGSLWAATATCYEKWKVDRTTTNILLVVNQLRTHLGASSALQVPSGTNYYAVMKALNIPTAGMLAFLMDSFIQDEQTRVQITKLASASEQALKTFSTLFMPSKAWAMVAPDPTAGMASAPSAMTTLWGDAKFYVYTANVNVPANQSDAFDLILDNIPRSACIKLALAVTDPSQAYAVAGAEGSVSGSDFNSYVSFGEPIIMETSQTLCGKGNTSSLGFRYLFRS